MMATRWLDDPQGARATGRLALAGATLALVLSACGGGGVSVTDTTATGPGPGGDGGWTWSLPAGFPVPAVPADNPMSAAKVELADFINPS